MFGPFPNPNASLLFLYSNCKLTSDFNVLMKIIFSFLFLLFALFAHSQTPDDKILEGFNIRNVGPAGMSGRITAIDVVVNEPNHIYIGSASGGVWESTDGGVLWKPIFDDQPSLSI